MCIDYPTGSSVHSELTSAPAHRSNQIGGEVSRTSLKIVSGLVTRHVACIVTIFPSILGQSH